jgi:hypothetical protein
MINDVMCCTYIERFKSEFLYWLINRLFKCLLYRSNYSWIQLNIFPNYRYMCTIRASLVVITCKLFYSLYFSVLCIMVFSVGLNNILFIENDCPEVQTLCKGLSVRLPSQLHPIWIVRSIIYYISLCPYNIHNLWSLLWTSCITSLKTADNEISRSSSKLKAFCLF